MSEVFDVEVSPDACLRLHYACPVPVTAFAQVQDFGGWPRSAMAEHPLLRDPTEGEITAACSRACGRTLYLWGWELRHCGTLAFHFRHDPCLDVPTWMETVEAGARAEPDPKQADLFGG